MVMDMFALGLSASAMYLAKNMKVRLTSSTLLA